MKTLNISLLVVLTMVVASQCFAEMVVEDVSKARAKELGVEIRTVAAGTNEVKVRIEFKTKGELKELSNAQLYIMDGKRQVLSATLQPIRSGSDDVLIYFTADHATLPKCSVTIAVGAVSDEGYEFKLKDFMERGKSHSGIPPATEQAMRQLHIGMTESQALEILKPVSMDWGRVTYGGTGAGELCFQVSSAQQIRLGVGPKTKKSTSGTSDESILSKISPGPEFFVNHIGPVEPKREWVSDKDHNIIGFATPAKDVH